MSHHTSIGAATARVTLMFTAAITLHAEAQQITPATGSVISHADLGNNYADPEILQDESLIVFQTGSAVWIGAIDPVTGLFAQGDGRNWPVATDASPLTVAKNGPEFGIDRAGWSIFYNAGTGTGPSDRVLVKRATPSAVFGSPFVVDTLTDTALDRVNQLPSKDPDADATYAIYGRSSPPGTPPTDAELDISWLCDEEPMTDNFITALRPDTAGFRWMSGTPFLTSTVGEIDAFGQIVLVNAETGERDIITNDAGVKFDPYGWLAPEFGGTRMVIAAINEADLAIYREAEPYWERVALLSPPVESGMTYIQSAEPFVVAGRSLVVLTLKNARGSIFDGSVTESQIWLYGIKDDPATRFALRVDDVDSPHPVRHEGEAYLGESELLIYYNDVRPTGLGMRVSRTGIGIESLCSADTNGNGLTDPGDFTAWVAAYNAGDPAADQNGNGVIEPGDFTAWVVNYNAGC